MFETQNIFTQQNIHGSPRDKTIYDNFMFFPNDHKQNVLNKTQLFVILSVDRKIHYNDGKIDLLLKSDH